MSASVVVVVILFPEECNMIHSTHNISTISQMYSSGGCQRSSVAHRADSEKTSFKDREFDRLTSLKTSKTVKMITFPSSGATQHAVCLKHDGKWCLSYLILSYLQCLSPGLHRALELTWSISKITVSPSTRRPNCKKKNVKIETTINNT